MNNKLVPTLIGLSAFLLAAPLQAETPIYPSADLRIQDATGNSQGNHSHAEDSTHEVLNLGDNAENQAWRSVIKFDLAANAEALRAAGRILFQATVRNRLLQVPKDWKLEVVVFPSTFSDSILISNSGERIDEYSAEGEVIQTIPGGSLKTGETIQIDVTDAVKGALESGVLALRMQLNPATNSDNHEDQVSFYAGSHEVNTPHLRPQLVLE